MAVHDFSASAEQEDTLKTILRIQNEDYQARLAALPVDVEGKPVVPEDFYVPAADTEALFDELVNNMLDGHTRHLLQVEREEVARRVLAGELDHTRVQG